MSADTEDAIMAAEDRRGEKDETPQEKFARWLEEGPKLAKAAGCYVGIRVTDASAIRNGG